MALINDNVDVAKLRQLLEGKNLKKAFVNAALFKGNDAKYTLRFLRITFLRNGETLSESKSAYRYVVFLRRIVNSDVALNLLERLYSGQEITLADIQISAVQQINPFMRADLASNYNYGYVLMDLPCIYLNTMINFVNQPNETFMKVGLPYYPDIDTAIFHELELGSKIRHPIESRLEVIIPDYRAKIAKVVIDGDDKSVILNVDSVGIPLENIIVKYYCSYTNKKAEYNKEDIRLHNGVTKLSVDGEILFMNIVILSQDNEVLDYRNFNYAFLDDYNGTVEVKGSGSTISYLIKSGESQRLEFKTGLDNKDDFVETVVAYANKNNGIILVGVDNKGNIIGLKEQYEKAKTKIENWIGDSCMPKPSFTVELVRSQDKEIAIVTVNEGDITSKPFALNGNKFFIRANSTDRQMDRVEIEKIFSQKYGKGTINLP